MWHGGGGYRWLYTDEFISLMICGPKGVVTRKLCNTPMRFNCAQIVWKEEYLSCGSVSWEGPEILKTDMPTTKEGLDEERERQPLRWSILEGYNEEKLSGEDVLYFDL